MNTTALNAIALAQTLKTQLGSELGVTIELNSYDSDPKIILTTNEGYEKATELCRLLGVGKREKRVFPGDPPWHTLEGKSEDGYTVRIFAQHLPPTCHIEKYTEKIPKKETVDTGDFIEVEREKIVCD